MERIPWMTPTFLMVQHMVSMIHPCQSLISPMVSNAKNKQRNIHIWFIYRILFLCQIFCWLYFFKQMISNAIKYQGHCWKNLITKHWILLITNPFTYRIIIIMYGWSLLTVTISKDAYPIIDNQKVMFCCSYNN